MGSDKRCRDLVYRGVNLSSELIELYGTNVGMYEKWLVFSSTSKYQAMTETFGNRLFVIDLKQNYYNKYSASIDITCES